MTRYAARKDANHDAVAAYMQRLGWSVVDTSRMGEGFPDCLVGRAGFCCPVEIKDGSKVKSKRSLTSAQKTWRAEWTGPYVLAESPEDAGNQLLALWRRWLRSPT